MSGNERKDSLEILVRERDLDQEAWVNLIESRVGNILKLGRTFRFGPLSDTYFHFGLKDSSSVTGERYNPHFSHFKWVGEASTLKEKILKTQAILQRGSGGIGSKCARWLSGEAKDSLWEIRAWCLDRNGCWLVMWLKVRQYYDDHLVKHIVLEASLVETTPREILETGLDIPDAIYQVLSDATGHNCQNAKQRFEALDKTRERMRAENELLRTMVRIRARTARR